MIKLFLLGETIYSGLRKFYDPIYLFNTELGLYRKYEMDRNFLNFLIFLT